MTMDSLDEITRDCFSAIVQLRRLDAGAVADPQAVHRRLCWFVETMIRQASEAGVPQEDTNEIAFAIVALADEVAVTAPGPLQQYWMSNLLQMRYFETNLAGESFYQRIQVLRAEPRRYECLKVYYLCLLLGFVGRYRVSGAETDRAALIEAIRQDLVRQGALGRDEVLSPRSARPALPGSRVRRNLPIMWLSAAAIATALLVNVVLHVVLSSGVHEVGAHIDALTTRAAKR